jgi:hypothetical protein
VVLVEEFAEGGDLLAMMMRHGGRLNELVAVNEVIRPLLAVLAHLHIQVSGPPSFFLDLLLDFVRQEMGQV